MFLIFEFSSALVLCCVSTHLVSEKEQLSEVREDKRSFVGSVKALLCGTGSLVMDSLHVIRESEIQTMHPSVLIYLHIEVHHLLPWEARLYPFL